MANGTIFLIFVLVGSLLYRILLIYALILCPAKLLNLLFSSDYFRGVFFFLILCKGPFHV